MVRELRELAFAGTPHVINFAEEREDRREAADGGFVAAGEDREGGVLGAAIAAGDGGVDGGAGDGGGGAGDFDGEGGVGGGHVDDGAARAEAGEDAGGGVEDDVADVGGVADDGENDVGLGGDGVRGGGPVGAQVKERLGFGLGSGEDGQGVAGFDEMAAHGPAHHAGADPAHTGVRGTDWLGGDGHGAAEMGGGWNWIWKEGVEVTAVVVE